MRRLFNVVLLVLLASPAPALAQPALCELHVWPFRPTDTTRSEQAALNSALSPGTQALAASSLDMLTLFGMTAGMVLFESDHLDLRSAPDSQHRLLPETPDCHAELIVMSNEYVGGSKGSSSLKTSFVLRDFRGGTLHLVRGSTLSPLGAFPARTEDQEGAARRDLFAAYAANITTFAKQLKQQKP
jgi:hypothetical protein